VHGLTHVGGVRAGVAIGGGWVMGNGVKHAAGSQGACGGQQVGYIYIRLRLMGCYAT
jgi:hypothetical protein